MATGSRKSKKQQAAEDKATLEAWSLGYAPDAWEATSRAALRAGFSDAELGGAGLTGPELDEAGEQLGLEQPLTKTELLRRRPRLLQLVAGRVESASQGFEHCLATDRRGLDRR